MEQQQSSAGAAFKLTMRWASGDVLPITLEYRSARETLSQMWSRQRDGMKVVGIEMRDESGATAISQTKLREIAYGKQKPPVRPRDRTRAARELLKNCLAGK